MNANINGGIMRRKEKVEAEARKWFAERVNRPCASHGLTSYRYKGRYGWIMIGATGTKDAVSEAKRSTDNVTIDNLQIWNGEKYINV